MCSVELWHSATKPINILDSLSIFGDPIITRSHSLGLEKQPRNLAKNKAGSSNLLGVMSQDWDNLPLRCLLWIGYDIVRTPMYYGMFNTYISQLEVYR